MTLLPLLPLPQIRCLHDNEDWVKSKLATRLNLKCLSAKAKPFILFYPHSFAVAVPHSQEPVLLFQCGSPFAGAVFVGDASRHHHCGCVRA